MKPNSNGAPGQSELLRSLKKYFDYFFETDGYTTDRTPLKLSSAASNAARVARGTERGPALMIHGVMPRSGTVYCGELLRLHPDLYPYPHQLWELPALPLSEKLRALQRSFLQAYPINRGRLAEADFMAIFGAGLVAYLYEPVPAGQRVLVKLPSVQYLNRFFTMFPCEHLLVLLRDGRDLVHSTLRTWPRLNFIQVCLRWNRSAQAVLFAAENLRAPDGRGFWIARYEDALQDPEGFVREACDQFDLDQSRYPFDRINEIRVIGSSLLEHQQQVSWRHIEKPRNFKPVGYWEQWPRIKKSIFKLIAGQPLIALGYAQDHDW